MGLSAHVGNSRETYVLEICFTVNGLTNPFKKFQRNTSTGELPPSQKVLEPTEEIPEKHMCNGAAVPTIPEKHMYWKVSYGCKSSLGNSREAHELDSFFNVKWV